MQKPLFIVVSAALAGCASSQTTEQSTAGAAPTQHAGEPKDSAAGSQPVTPGARHDIRAKCAKEIKRQIECKDVFVPMIVDTRVRLDLPPGIAGRGKDEVGRKRLVTMAMAEFVKAYTPEKTAAICEVRQAQVDKMPPAVLERLKTTLDADCLSKADCEGFTRCMAPVLEQMLRMGAKSGAGGR